MAKREKTPWVPNSDLDAIMTIEGGDATDEQMIASFQYLINDGVVWKLQGFYGRTAKSLIEQGICHAA